MIFVTKTFLPPQEEYLKLINEIWDTNQIANGGELHKNLRKTLAEFLEVDNVILTANGTIPLQISLKSLGGKGEIITTPFSYVATTSSIVWENCKPVFVDIDPEYLTIDETKIEAAVTKNTTTILATHVFGNTCNTEAIERIAEKYNLKVIYDAAHCFGVKYKGTSLFNYGDVSTCSFHATKLFHTGEGGAIFCKDIDLYKDLFDKHNFGHKSKLDFSGLGINGKMSELQAGMGLAILPYVQKLIEARKKIVAEYNKLLNLEKIKTIKIRAEVDWNYSYYPVIFENENILLKVETALKKNNIYPRRYFYPSLNTLNYVEYSEMKNSESISKSILCLPLYYNLAYYYVERISDIINNAVYKNKS